MADKNIGAYAGGPEDRIASANLGVTYYAVGFLPNPIGYRYVNASVSTAAVVNMPRYAWSSLTKTIVKGVKETYSADLTFYGADGTVIGVKQVRYVYYANNPGQENTGYGMNLVEFFNVPLHITPVFYAGLRSIFQEAMNYQGIALPLDFWATADGTQENLGRVVVSGVDTSPSYGDALAAASANPSVGVLRVHASDGEVLYSEPSEQAENWTGGRTRDHYPDAWVGGSVVDIYEEEIAWFDPRSHTRVVKDLFNEDTTSHPGYVAVSRTNYTYNHRATLPSIPEDCIAPLIGSFVPLTLAVTVTGTYEAVTGSWDSNFAYYKQFTSSLTLESDRGKWTYYGSATIDQYYLGTWADGAVYRLVATLTDNYASTTHNNIIPDVVTNGIYHTVATVSGFGGFLSGVRYGNISLDRPVPPDAVSPAWVASNPSKTYITQLPSFAEAGRGTQYAAATAAYVDGQNALRARRIAWRRKNSQDILYLLSSGAPSPSVDWEAALRLRAPYSKKAFRPVPLVVTYADAEVYDTTDPDTGIGETLTRRTVTYSYTISVDGRPVTKSASYEGTRRIQTWQSGEELYDYPAVTSRVTYDKWYSVYSPVIGQPSLWGAGMVPDAYIVKKVGVVTIGALWSGVPVYEEDINKKEWFDSRQRTSFLTTTTPDIVANYRKDVPVQYAETAFSSPDNFVESSCYEGQKVSVILFGAGDRGIFFLPEELDQEIPSTLRVYGTVVFKMGANGMTFLSWVPVPNPVGEETYRDAKIPYATTTAPSRFASDCASLGYVPNALFAYAAVKGPDVREEAKALLSNAAEDSLLRRVLACL